MEDSTNNLRLFSFLLWHIWKARNHAIFEHELLDPLMVCNQAVQAFSEYKDSCILETTVSSADIHTNGRQNSWLPPPEGTIKINYDAASDSNKKFGTIGIVAADYLGRILPRFTAFVRYIWDPRALEWLALHTAMNFAITKGWQNIIFEGDAIQIPHTLTRLQACPAKKESKSNDTSATATLAFNAGEINLRASTTDATVVKGLRASMIPAVQIAAMVVAAPMVVVVFAPIVAEMLL
ncbi:uncharacterized protein LOC126681678 [Mercurialis annua]|uniref:uncharacterized protein LOC126681678 n=1 Tax=Mercurialis annua TaxID=3986 RepID=UPI00215DE24F|nr:uncharacterized protein LOC126681678 [Mercurialis annua]